MTDILKIQNLLKLLTDVAEWAEDLQNNMDRLREDLDEFCKSQKISSSNSGNNDSGSGFDSEDLKSSASSDDESDMNSSDASGNSNVDDLDCLNGNGNLTGLHSHSNDLTIIIDLERPEHSLVHNGTDFEKITDRVIDLEDEVVMYRNKIVYSVVANRLVDMSDAWDKACLNRESRILMENKRYQDLARETQASFV